MNRVIGDIDQSLATRIGELLDPDDRKKEEQATLIKLMCIFADLPKPPDPIGLFHGYTKLKETFIEATHGTDSETLEEAFLNLYCLVHGHEAPYTANERKRVDETGGYWCHAGGLSPILKAEQFIKPSTVFGDYGAGNGLQGLLIQKLWPHEKTIQIEISSRMVEAGKHLQKWLHIPEERVKWVVGDVADTSPRDMDFIYMYRPLRPEGPGEVFYTNFAKELDSSLQSRIVIFSIADCLRSFLPSTFEVFYSDGHLTCFRK